MLLLRTRYIVPSPPSLSPLPVPSSTVVVGRPRTSLSVVVHTLAPPPAHLGKLAGNTTVRMQSGGVDGYINLYSNIEYVAAVLGVE